MFYLKWKCHAVDPCLYIKWIEGKLLVFLLWTDNCLIAGQQRHVEFESKEFFKLNEVTDEGNMEDYVGCKVNWTPKKIQLTQPVKIQRFKDKFWYTVEGVKKFKTPAKPGSVLADEAIGDQTATEEEHKQYRLIARITNHMVCWSRKDCQNAQRKILQFFHQPTKTCLEAHDRLTNFIVGTPKCDYTIKPENSGKWDGTRDYLFKIVGESDSEYAKHPSCRSINSGATFLNRALVRMWCRMMHIVALSTCEAELYSEVFEAMDMMFCYYLFTSLGLTVELPMILYMDNTAAVALANNWSIGGHDRHLDVKQNYLCELKERGFIHCLHKDGKTIIPDINTKNLAIQSYWKLSNQFMSFNWRTIKIMVELQNHQISSFTYCIFSFNSNTYFSVWVISLKLSSVAECMIYDAQLTHNWVHDWVHDSTGIVQLKYQFRSLK